MRLKLFGVAAVAVTAAACGYDTTDRVAGGAATGAATGAVVGGPVGAVVGGVAGGAAGAATTPDQLNLGRPPWSNPEVEVDLQNDRPGRPASRSAASRSSRARSNSDRAYMGGGAVVENGRIVGAP
jgi:hypothetical protein